MATQNISLSASMRNNLLSLQNTQKLFDMTQERLSTGKKVNSALDNPASYFTSQSLNARANELNLILDSVGQAIQMIKAADNGIETLRSFVEQAKSLVNQALDTNNTSSYITGGVSVDLNTDLGTVGGIRSSDAFVIRKGEAHKIVGTASLTLDQTADSINFVTTHATNPAFFSVRLSADDGTYQEVKVIVPKGQEATTTVQDMLNQITEGFGFDDRGNPKVTAELVDGKFTITSTDREKTLTVIEGNNGATPPVPTTFAQDCLGLDPGYTIDFMGYSKKYELVSDVGGLTMSTLAANLAGSTPPPATSDIASPLEIGLGGVGANNDTSGAFNVRSFTITDTTTIGDLITQINQAFGEDLKASLVGGELKLVAADPTQEISMNAQTVLDPDYPTVDVANTYELLNKINQLDGITAELTKNHKIKISTDNGENLVISDLYNYTTNDQGRAAAALGLAGAGLNGTEVRKSLAANFDKILEQIDGVKEDTGYQGVNLLNGDTMVVNFNEYRTTSLTIEGVVFDTKGLALKNAKNDWATKEDIEKSLSQVDYANVLLKNQASEFGYNLSSLQTREDFTKNVENILTEGSDKLVLADMNEEAANMLALQVRQQLGTNALSLSSQAQQAVLGLFG